MYCCGLIKHTMFTTRAFQEAAEPTNFFTQCFLYIHKGHSQANGLSVDACHFGQALCFLEVGQASHVGIEERVCLLQMDSSLVY